MKGEQSKPISTFPANSRKIWFWGIILFLILFGVIIEASKFKGNKPAEPVVSFNAVDALPYFPNGEQAFGNYLQHHIRNHSAARGRVIVSFMVSKSGSIKDVKILRGLNAEADQEVVRALEDSPKWIPGKQKGRAVNVAYALPVNFEK